MDIERLKLSIKPLLQEIGRPETIAQLQQLLTDPEARTRARPWQVNRYTPETFPGIQEVWDDVARAIAGHLTANQSSHRLSLIRTLQYAPSAEAIEGLARCLGVPDLQVQMVAVNALAEIGLPSIAPLLLPRLGADAPLVRMNAAAALGQIKAAMAFPLLVDLLDRDPDPFVRYWVAQAIAEVEPELAREPLLARLHDPDLPDEVVFGVQLGLAALGPDVADQLLLLASSHQPLLRVRAIEAMAPFETAEVDQFLQGALDSEDMETQLAAAWVLAKHDKPAGFSRLRSELISTSSEQHLTAACYLTSLGVVTGLRELAASYFDPGHLRQVRNAISRFPRSQRAELTYFVENETDSNRARAFADMTGVLGVGEATSALLGRVQDSDHQVSLAAAVALIRLHGVEMRAPLDAVLEQAVDPLERTRLTRSLRELSGPIPLEVCETLISDGCAGVVIVGLELLASHPDPQAEDWIATVLEMERQRRTGELPAYQVELNEAIFGRTAMVEQLVDTGEPFRQLLPLMLREPMRMMERDGWSSPSIAVAMVAMSALAGRDATRYIRMVEPFLHDEHPLLRLRALDVCVSLVGSQALVVAGQLASDPSPVVRYWWKRRQGEQLH